MSISPIFNFSKSHIDLYYVFEIHLIHENTILVFKITQFIYNMSLHMNVVSVNSSDMIFFEFY